MKKLGKLLINQEKVLKNEELVNLKGGDLSVYWCICGFTGGYTSGCFPELGSSIEQALQRAGATCDGAGATCSGDGCPE